VPPPSMRTTRENNRGSMARCDAIRRTSEHRSVVPRT
jgi:hypothetical protein